MGQPQETTRSGMGIALYNSQSGIHFVTLDGEMYKVRGIGVVDTKKLEGKEFGTKIQILDKEYTILKPSLGDLLATLKRGAQVIHPKDAAWIAFSCCVGPGDTVIEAGTGTGALTTVLAHSVGPEGKVISIDIRPEHQETAKINIRRAGYQDRVDFRVGDVTEILVKDIAEDLNVKAIILDMPEPEPAVKPAFDVIVTGGYILTYTPTVEQLSRSQGAIKDAGFKDLTSEEIIHRSWTHRECATRPIHDMLGHTAFITRARKV